jgi:hypothetical protein
MTHRPSSVVARDKVRSLALLGCLIVSVTIQGCSGSGGGDGSSADISGGVHLTALHQGKLVDVYGLRTIGTSQVIDLFQTDLLVGPDIQDQRDSTSNKTDSEILYDFISANPDTLQPRLLITREISSAEFGEAVAELDRNLRLISPDQFGKNTSKTSYPVVPRNAALRLTFSGPLRFSSEDLYDRDANGKITSYKNSEAIQLLKIVGNPNDKRHDGDFVPVPIRTVVRGNQIIVDPVLLGGEGLVYGHRNSASGMPESPDQRGANIRLAVALEGPLSIPGLAEDRFGTLSGRNNQTYRSIIRDFRSGNANDNSADLARGFLRDPLPPRLVGNMLMYLERVEEVSDKFKLVTVFKDGIEHELDRGDLLRLFADSNSVPLASIEILRDPADDLGKPEVQRVRVLVRPVVDAKGTDLLEKNDPSNLPGFPVFAGPARDKFVRENAPRMVLVAEFTYRRIHPGGDPKTPYYGDDPRNFLSFNPNPLPADNGIVITNENISPFAGAVLRFSKPIDMSTVIALDTAFFGTRNVLDRAAIAKFVADRKIEPAEFDPQKFRTPHLIHSRVFDEDGSQSAIRVQPTLGFYLDQSLRDAAKADAHLPFSQRRYHYFLHLVSGADGITDLSGNPLDFQAVVVSGLEVADKLVLEFALETRIDPIQQTPRFEDNLVAYVVRRFASADEDERPNYYLPGEVTPERGLTPADAYPVPDFFGPIAYLPSGQLITRAGTRTTKIVDEINQISAPPQSSSLRWCPLSIGAPQVVFQTAATAFGQPIQNPLNPYGCRLQQVWREIDMSLSRTDPQDFNLDVEQMYWAPFKENPIYFDEFDRVSLYLGHSEFRPETCINTRSAFPSFGYSGLFRAFAANYAHNLKGLAQVGYKPKPHPAYIDAVLSISPKDAILDPTGSFRFLPLPRFIDATKAGSTKNKYFIWRDEQVISQGGFTRIAHTRIQPYPYILSPFLAGMGRHVTGSPSNLQFVNGGWYNHRPANLSTGTFDRLTHGLVGSIALPLLADFWTYPDSPQKPVNDPFVASGINGWQISLPVTASPQPNFRCYSAGRGGKSPILIDPSHSAWQLASGGFTPAGGTTTPNDNSVYWVMADFLKRTTVVTAGFVEITNPHRMPTGSDPRLGPFTKTSGLLPDFAYDFEPPLSQLPSGTTVVTEFRAASELDQQTSAVWPKVGSNKTNATNFPNDPLKSGDAFVRHWDDRRGRNWWTYMYNKTITTYVDDPNQLMRTKFTNSFSGPSESFEAKDVKYFNWRFIMKNNLEVDPPLSPRVESFAISYRFVPDSNR